MTVPRAAELHASSVDDVLRIEGLRVELDAGPAVVDGVAFSVRRGEVFGIVGESGSGKTTTALAALGFARPGVRIVSGSVSVLGEELVGRRESELRNVRGRLISYVPQEPAAAINPSIRVGAWIKESVRTHFPTLDPGRAVVEALERVGLPSDQTFQRRFVHQLSGGQAQRVAIATAFIGEPPVVVLDEPTTGLDVVTQAVILQEIARLQQSIGVSMIYVSHDLSVVGSVADRIAVMYAGRIVELGQTRAVLHRCAHPYTRGLISSVPDHAEPQRLRAMPGVAAGVGEGIRGCVFAPRCPQRVSRCELEPPELTPVGDGHAARCFEWRRTPSLEFEPALVNLLASEQSVPLLSVEQLRAIHRGHGHDIVAANEVSFSISRGESVALVGESGSGKTTIARCVAGLHVPESGRILIDGVPLASSARKRPVEHRRRIQIVFQNPNDSLNPDHRISDTVARPLRLLGDGSKREVDTEVARLLELVRLPARLGRRYPAELSGGERQRVAIARALAAKPDLVICDEITSALDVSVQAAVLEVLAELREQLGLALLFISHDLGVVAAIADRILVLQDGTLREQGTTRGLLTSPSDPYTRLLVASAPRLT